MIRNWNTPGGSPTRIIASLLVLGICVLVWSGGYAPTVQAQGALDEHIVAITASGAEGLAAFDATVLYDPDTVGFVEIRPGDFLPEGSVILGPTLGIRCCGSVTFGSYSPTGATVDGSGTLVEVVFTLLGDAAPELSLDGASSGLYGADGARLGPPARLSVMGASAEAIYLPFAVLRH